MTRDQMHGLDFKLNHLAAHTAAMHRMLADGVRPGLVPFGNFLGLRHAATDAFHFAALVLDHDPDLHAKLKVAAQTDAAFLALRDALPRAASMADGARS